MKLESEAKIQQEIVAYIRKTYCKPDMSPRLVLHSIPNGIGLESTVANMPVVKKAIAKAIEIMKLIGLMPGASDLLLHGVGGKCACIEVKTSTGVQSEAQKSFEARIQSLGGYYFLVRSLEDVKKIDFSFLLEKK